MTTDRTPTTLDAAWEALLHEINHNLDEGDAILARHRPLIEAALRAEPRAEGLAEGYIAVKEADLLAVRDTLEKAQALNRALLPAVIEAAARENPREVPTNGPKREYIGYAALAPEPETGS